MKDSRPILIVGAHGQVGRSLLLASPNESVGLGRAEVDVSQPEKIENVLNQFSPRVLINAAAYTQVDQAEIEKDLAFRVNALAPEAMAKWCRKRNIPFIHYSTDYVFSGEGTEPWLETDPVAPINEYGRTKAEGEARVHDVGANSLIFRTSWVYDSQGKNFLNTMIRLGTERDNLQIVSDQIGAPTYARHLANATLAIVRKIEGELLSTQSRSGVYHLCNSGSTSWYEFATEILKLARIKNNKIRVKSVQPILTQDYPTRAKRPMNSRLCISKVEAQFDLKMPEWHEGLKECMKALYG